MVLVIIQWRAEVPLSIKCIHLEYQSTFRYKIDNTEYTDTDSYTEEVEYIQTCIICRIHSNTDSHRMQGIAQGRANFGCSKEISSRASLLVITVKSLILGISKM